MNNLTRLVRCNKQSPCPICGKPDWCSLAEDGSFAICMRQADGAHKPTKNGGWLHVLRRHAGGALPRAMRHSEVINLPCEARFQKFAALAGHFQYNMTMRQLADAANSLSVSRDSLRRLAVGWSRQDWAYSFPMRDAQGRVCGIRLRNVTGDKWACPDSREGLFIPADLASTGALTIAEGATDTLALLDWGFIPGGKGERGRELILRKRAETQSIPPVSSARASLKGTLPDGTDDTDGLSGTLRECGEADFWGGSL